MRGLWAALLLLVLSGCTVPTPGAPEAVPEDPGVPAWKGLETALFHADAWSREAYLVGVMAFEFNASGMDPDNPLLAPYDRSDPVVGDGLAHVWTYAFHRTTLVPIVGGPPVTYIVHVAEGEVVDAYETTKREHGAVEGAPLEEGLLDSDEAAEQAEHDGGFRAAAGPDAVGTVTLHSQDEPVWEFVLRREGSQDVHVSVDARSGELRG